MNRDIKVWRVTHPADLPRAFAARFAALEDLEPYPGKAPGDPLDAADLRPETDHIIGTYGGQLVGTGRVVYWPHLPSAPILETQGWQPGPNPALWAEGTRGGVIPKLRETDIGRFIGRRILGLMIDASIRRGCTGWTATMRAYDAKERRVKGMFWLLRHYPWQLWEPVALPMERGGPDVDEPILVATLPLAQVRLAVRHLDPGHYEVMFPAPAPAALNEPPATAELLEHLAALSQSNQDRVNEWIAKWLSGKLELLVP